MMVPEKMKLSCIITPIWDRRERIVTVAMSGVLIAFTAYIGRFWAPINTLASFYNSLLTAISYLERIFETIDEPVLVKDVENLVVLVLADKGLGDPDAIDALRDVGIQVALLVAHRHLLPGAHFRDHR